MEEINIEEIMEEIRQEIKEKGYKPSDLSFQDIPIEQKTGAVGGYSEQQLCDSLRLANTHTRVDFYKPITKGGVKAVLKKAVRKLMKPIILPLCEEQERYNASAVQVLNQMYQYMLFQEKKINELESMIRKKEN